MLKKKTKKEETCIINLTNSACSQASKCVVIFVYVCEKMITCQFQ